MNRAKNLILIGLTVISIVICAGCSEKNTDTQIKADATTTAEHTASSSPETTIASDTTETGSQEETDAVADSTEDKISADASADWIKEGNYIDKEENHLALYYQTVAGGYKKDGWASISMLRGSIYNGELTEENGILYGTLTAYKSDGTEGDTMQVVILEGDGDSIILSTNDGMDYTFYPDDTDYS